MEESNFFGHQENCLKSWTYEKEGVIETEKQQINFTHQSSLKKWGHQILINCKINFKKTS